MATVTSAALIGMAVFSVTAILGLWAIEVFANRPSAGAGAVLLLGGVGQLLGPTLAGLVAQVVSVHAAFLAAAALSFGGPPAPRRGDP